MTGRYRRTPDSVYYFGVLPFLALLPKRLAYALVRSQGLKVYRAQDESRTRSIGNLQSVLGLAPAEASEVALRSFQMMVAEDLETYYLLRLRSQLDRAVDAQGLQYLAAADQEGNGMVLVTGHLGPIATAAVALGVKGFPVSTVTHDLRKDPAMSRTLRLFGSLRLRLIERGMGGRLIYVDLARETGERRRGPLIALGLLHKGGAVMLPLDVPPQLAGNTEEVSFFGRRCIFPSGPVRLAHAAKAPIVPYFIIRDDRDWTRLRLEVEEPVPLTGSVAKDLQSCVERLEQRIRAHPAHWFTWDSWTHFEVKQTRV